MTDVLRVLFVDDDPAWLNAIRRIVRRSNPQWDVHYIEDGFAALELIDRLGFDVIVSDLNMPGLRGDSLLTQVAEAHPEILRFMLSGATQADCGQSEHILAMEFIDKDAPASDLLFRIARGVSLRRFMKGQIVDRLATAVSSLGDLPNMVIKVINPKSNSPATQRAPFLEIACPDLGLEFRTPLIRDEIVNV
ncbi:MAG: response regulator [Planctomycetaceae bacterium]